jgi:ribosomal protein S18 acetylase RimI-like enzyme
VSKQTPFSLYKQLMVMHHKINPILYPSKRISKKYFNDKLKTETLSELRTPRGALVGIALCYFRDTTMVITTFVVDGKYRGKGYGKKLMDQILEDAKKRGCNAIHLQVSAANYVAREFYERYEFVDSSISMIKELQ